MKVTVREKAIKQGRKSLYLDFYPPVINQQTGKPTRREFLQLYIYEKPKTDIEKNHNKETRILANSICARRQLDLQAGQHGFTPQSKRNGDFLAFLQKTVDKRKNDALSTFRTWQSVYKHFTNFCEGRCTFAQIDRKYVEDFREYLLYEAQNQRFIKDTRLSPNTASAIFFRFCSTVREAFRQKYLSEDPTIDVKTIKMKEPNREFLTLEELQLLAKTQCDIPDDFRRAALFSALSGLRHSDIQKLLWGEIRQSENGSFLQIQIKKTGEGLVLPISDEALALLGERGANNEKVFPTLRYSIMTNVHLARWLLAAGIGRKLGFHAFRRTYATALISLGEDIYTVQKMLGHSNIQMTQIYAKLVDEKKREAANKITLK